MKKISLITREAIAPDVIKEITKENNHETITLIIVMVLIVGILLLTNLLLNKNDNESN